MQTILVTDEPQAWEFLSAVTTVVPPGDYLSNEYYYQSNSMRIINLCNSYNYQTIGYYVSLLALARDHKAIPSVLSIQDILSSALSKQISQELEEEIQHSLFDIRGEQFVLSLYFGQNIAKRHAQLSKRLFALFPIPLLRISFEKKKQWVIKKLEPISVNDIPATHQEFMQESALSFFCKKRFHQWKKKQRYHDLAILVDNNEANAPSNKRALELFAKAGDEMGLNVDFIDKTYCKSIAEYDALFIRSTTSVDHHTFRMARRAIQENLVVIDDPQSIVKCSNKVYLAELMQSHQIATPQTLYINKYDKSLPEIEFPCVLKRPDGAFSQGVVKLDNKKDLQKSLSQFFKTSDLIILQAFIPTDFDWRIGVLDNKPLYACRYFMAKGHWQIYNWNNKANNMGDYETVPLSAVPEAVIKTALKATRPIGDSLYGVDIKSVGDKTYVIEVNDNPNIDFGIEDLILGETLYHEIMSVFLQRIRRKHGYV